MARCSVKESKTPTVIPIDKVERKKYLNTIAQRKHREKQKVTIEELTAYVKVLKRVIMEKDFEIRYLKMKLESVEEHWKKHQELAPGQMVPVIHYPNEQAPMYAVGVPFASDQQQNGPVGVQPIPIQSAPFQQFYVSDYLSPTVPLPSDTLSQTPFINPRAPEAPVYQELLVQQVPEVYNRSNDLPPTDPKTHSTIHKPIILFSPENRNSLMSSISIGTTPADYKRILATLMQDPPLQEGQNYGRPSDLPPSTHQSFQKPSSTSFLTPDSLRIQAMVLTSGNIISKTPVEFKRIFEKIKQQDAPK